MLYKVVATFKSVDETLVCDHSNESYWAVLSCGTVYYAVQGCSNCSMSCSLLSFSLSQNLSPNLKPTKQSKRPKTRFKIKTVMQAQMLLRTYREASWSKMMGQLCSMTWMTCPIMKAKVVTVSLMERPNMTRTWSRHCSYSWLVHSETELATGSLCIPCLSTHCLYV